MKFLLPRWFRLGQRGDLSAERSRKFEFTRFEARLSLAIEIKTAESLLIVDGSNREAIREKKRNLGANTPFRLKFLGSRQKVSFTRVSGAETLEEIMGLVCLRNEEGRLLVNRVKLHFQLILSAWECSSTGRRGDKSAKKVVPYTAHEIYLNPFVRFAEEV